MKKLIVLSLFIFVSCFLTTQQGPQLSEQISGKSFVSEGWADDDTFRVIAVGIPKAGLENKMKRKITSREAALTMAQRNILNRFRGASITSKSEINEGETGSLKVTRELKGVITGGHIIKETYDEEDNCEIIYEIRSTGLKKRIEDGMR